MKNELSLLIKKHTDTLIERTKTKRKETIEFKLNKQMKTFSFNPLLNFSEKGNSLLTVTSSETTNSVFNISDENKRFSITILDHWNSKSAEKTIDELNIILELRSQNDIELLVEQIRKTGIFLLNDYSSSNLDTLIKEILEDLINAIYNDPEDIVYRRQLTYDEIVDTLGLKYILTKRRTYYLNLGLYEKTDISETLEYILPDNVKVNITTDDNRLKPNLNNNQTLMFTKRSFFLHNTGFDTISVRSFG